MKKCSPPLGIPYNPQGVGEIDPCRYKAKEAWKNVTVMVLECTKCGNTEVVWYMQDNSEQIDPEIFDQNPPVPVIGGKDER